MKETGEKKKKLKKPKELFNYIEPRNRIINQEFSFKSHNLITVTFHLFLCLIMCHWMQIFYATENYSYQNIVMYLLFYILK